MMNSLKINQAHRTMKVFEKYLDTILEMLLMGESDVTTLQTIIHPDQSVTSQVLAKLKSIGIVIRRRDGKRIYYKVNMEAFDRIVGAIQNFSRQYRNQRVFA